MLVGLSDYQSSCPSAVVLSWLDILVCHICTEQPRKAEERYSWWVWFWGCSVTWEKAIKKTGGSLHLLSLLIPSFFPVPQSCLFAVATPFFHISHSFNCIALSTWFLVADAIPPFPCLPITFSLCGSIDGGQKHCLTFVEINDWNINTACLRERQTERERVDMREKETERKAMSLKEQQNKRAMERWWKTIRLEKKEGRE